MQLKFISKEEAHKMIDAVPGNTIMVMEYNSIFGISDYGKHIKKQKGRRYVDKSSVVVLSQNSPITMLNLHRKFFDNFEDYEREDIVRSILLPKLE